MKTFDRYAMYYDLMYKDKDYSGEAAYIHELIRKYAPSARTILEMGCGTGAHAVHLARKGYTVHGVDSSSKMIARAGERRLKISEEESKRLSFSEGDIRELKLNKRFDAALALFHVMSYQTTDDDLMSTFLTAKKQLKPGGIFIFDCWYGPAVLRERPEVRIRRLENKEISIVRIAEPVMDVNENRVDVNYQIFIHNKKNGSIEELKEIHSMRYLFMPEIRALFDACQMEMVFSYGWLTDNQPGSDTWGACFGAKARQEE